ncbi:MAG: VWA domain-containing protein [Pyrinomonadaceae bacterium]
MNKSLKSLFRLSLIAIAILSCASAVVAQSECLSADEIKAMLTQVNSLQQVGFNLKLSEQLIKLKLKSDERLANDVADNKKSEELIKRLRNARRNNAAELCKIMKTAGWPSKALVGQEGVDAAFSLLRDSSPFETQVKLLPVIIAATRQGEIEKPNLAAFIDLLRLKTGSRQLFGTQATIKEGFLILYPIEAEEHVDARRKQFGLGLLADALRDLERIYRLPLIRATGALSNEFSERARKSVTAATSELVDASADEVEVVRVDTNLVNLNVSVYSNKLRTRVSTLEKADFTIAEDGHPETIDFFAATDIPFDLVLLLDLSGSTADKRELIQQSTLRFIEAARPTDRIAIVTFSDRPTVISPLTEDRKKLIESTAYILGVGGSRVWDALKFTLDKVVGPKTLSRRRAVVFMTDGADNALLGSSAGSMISFADLLEAVRQNDAMIIPIYLDTEGDDALSHRIYENARNTLSLLADESGGLYYKARKIKDLNDVYDQVIADLGKVYSLGYRPSNDKRDGSWRTVRISIPNHPELQAKARPGYYAN